MPGKRTRTWLAVALGGGLVLGCQTTKERPAYSGDPLLVSKAPVEGKADFSPPIAVAEAEPEPPPQPYVGLASRPLTPPADSAPSPDVTPTATPGTGRPITTIATVKTPAPAVPAVRTKVISGARALPASRQVTGVYGNAPDYSWLQGVLDRHYLGHLNLRYCDHSVEDKWGGKVVLENDPRLAQFQEGDVIEVQGEIVELPNPAVHGAWSHYPHYRIHDVRLVRHGQE